MEYRKTDVTNLLVIEHEGSTLLT